MKKQIAVLMAAATAATTVAPVVANADSTTTDAKILDWVSKAKAALDDKYKPAATGIKDLAVPTDGNDYLKSKKVVLLQTSEELTVSGLVAWESTGYNNKLTVPSELLSNGTVTNVYVVTDADALQTALETVATNGYGAKFAIFDKGVNGDLPTVDSKTPKYTDFSTDLSEAGAVLSELQVEVSYKDINGKKLASASELAYTATFKFKNGATQDVKLGDDKLDFEKLQDKSGNGVKKEDSSYLDALSKFGVVEAGTEDVSYDLPQSAATVDILNSATVVDKDASTLYTAENGFTEAGKDFIEAFRDFNKADGKAFNYNAKAYSLLKDPAIKANSTITKVGDDYILVIDAKVKNSNDTQRTDTLEFRIKGKVQADLNTLRDYLFGDQKVVVGRFNRLVGSDRYQTAIEVSKKRFEKDGSADSVVIVGGNALLDGLSAAPLASAQNASVLLASPRTGLSQATLDEISRATDKKLVKKTVYVIGGYDSVPASVDKVLADKFGAVVIRIAGADRYETSKKIAERLVYDDKVDKTKGKIFYVGGNGAADAMSVAPVAATKDANGKVSPILVVKKDNIDQQTRNFLMSKLGAATKDVNNYIIGGESNVSSQVYSLLSKLDTKVNLERISGVDRYATNVTTLKKFYKAVDSEVGKISTKGVIVASGANNALVDAQTAGEFAASKGLPILLAGSKLTDGQTDLINVNKGETVFYKNVSKTATADYQLPTGFKANVYQVGGAVSSDAMKVIVDKFGLTETSTTPAEIPAKPVVE